MKKLLLSIAFPISVFAVVMLIFSAFRLAMFWICGNADLLGDASAGTILFAFVNALRFDSLITCSILALPLIALAATAFFAFPRHKIWLAAQIWCSVCFVVALFFSAANIPYFNNFSKTINGSILNWLDEPTFVIGMIVGEWTLIVNLLVFIVLCAGFCWLIFWLRQQFETRAEAFPPPERNPKKLAAAGTLCLVCLVALVIGIRGSFSPQTLKIGHAYFCSTPFLNELSLNPMFVFVKTTQDSLREKDKGVKLRDPAAAEKFVREFLGVPADAKSPIARHVPAKPEIARKNVVIVMMESMSYDFFERPELTPVLNELAKKSLFFPNAFSNGMHTINGIYALQFGYPPLLAQHPFKSTSGVLKYYGIAEILRERGYATYFITSQDDQFDNVGGWIRANGTEKIISYNDYPPETILSKLGPPDDYAMKFSVPVLTRDQAESGKPFFAYYMTTCNHHPRVIPDYFKPKSDDRVEQTVELTDYAVGEFLKRASQEPWFKNTIFVFVGDHGTVNYGSAYAEALPGHHTPLIFYTPDDETPRVCQDFALQIDVPATLFGMLGFEYDNETFGIDLLEKKRPYAFWSSDYSVAALDDEYYWFEQLLTKKQFLYKNWRDGNLENLIDVEPERAAAMREYAESFIQTAQAEVKKKEIGK